MNDSTTTNARLQNLSASDLRKLQLIDIACDLIACEGLDAVKHSTLAKLAGCTRALVYHYFPKRSDIFISIAESFYADFDHALAVEHQLNAVVDFNNTALGRPFIELIFGIIEQRGIGAAVLVNTPVLDRELQQFESEIQERFQQRWWQAFATLGIVGPRAKFLLANSLSAMINVFQLYSQNEISRETAVDYLHSSVVALVAAAVNAAK